MKLYAKIHYEWDKKGKPDYDVMFSNGKLVKVNVTLDELIHAPKNERIHCSIPNLEDIQVEKRHLCKFIIMNGF